MTPEITLNLRGAKTRTAKSITRYIAPSVRILVGAAFTIFGLNGFLNFIPQPTTPLPAAAVAFMEALIATGYMLQLIAATQLIVGVLLLSNRFVPLALALLAPFIVNSILFHIFLEPTGRPMAFIVLALELYLAWTYRASYKAMLAARVAPVNN